MEQSKVAARGVGGPRGVDAQASPRVAIRAAPNEVPHGLPLLVVLTDARLREEGRLDLAFAVDGGVSWCVRQGWRDGSAPIAARATAPAPPVPAAAAILTPLLTSTTHGTHAPSPPLAARTAPIVACGAGRAPPEPVPTLASSSATVASTVGCAPRPANEPAALAPTLTTTTRATRAAIGLATCPAATQRSTNGRWGGA